MLFKFSYLSFPPFAVSTSALTQNFSAVQVIKERFTYLP